MKKAANNNFGRLTTGPLYSQSQLQKAMDFLLQDGYLPVQSVEGIGGARTLVNTHDRQKSVILCLDELGCNPGLSGIMYFSDNGQTTTDTVWDYAKRRELENTHNPVKRLMKHFSL